MRILVTNLSFYTSDTYVCKLKKDLYGLNKDARSWYERIDSFLMSLGFTKSKADPNLYFKVMDDEPIILLLYMDDLFMTDNDKKISECKKRSLQNLR